MKPRQIEKFALQFAAGAIDRARTALLLMLKLTGDRLQEFSANFRRPGGGR